MSNNIPEIKIGTNLSDLKNQIQNNTSLSNTQKDSIFNFIQDEARSGDGKITTKVELSMLLSWLKPGNKDAEVEMPQVRGENVEHTIDNSEEEGYYCETYSRYTKEGEEYAFVRIEKPI
jgi:hypothetical protein